MNEVLNTIARRYSCRAFEERTPEKEALQAIAEAAVQAPSAMNRQPWQVIVITDKGLIEDIDAAGMALLAAEADQSAHQRMMERGGKLFYNAPCMFLIAMQPGTGMDVGIVSQNIALAAASLGLGSCICGYAALPLGGPRGAEFLQRAGVAEGWEFGISVLVGHPVGQGNPHAPDTGKIHWVE